METNPYLSCMETNSHLSQDDHDTLLEMELKTAPPKKHTPIYSNLYVGSKVIDACLDTIGYNSRSFYSKMFKA